MDKATDPQAIHGDEPSSGSDDLSAASLTLLAEKWLAQAQASDEVVAALMDELRALREELLQSRQEVRQLEKRLSQLKTKQKASKS